MQISKLRVRRRLPQAHRWSKKPVDGRWTSKTINSVGDRSAIYPKKCFLLLKCYLPLSADPDLLPNPRSPLLTWTSLTNAAASKGSVGPSDWLMQNRSLEKRGRIKARLVLYRFKRSDRTLPSVCKGPVLWCRGSISPPIYLVPFHHSTAIQTPFKMPTDP